MKKLFLFLMIIGLQGFCFAQSGEEKCPAARREGISGICTAMYQQYAAIDPDNGLGFSYQEMLWQISCAKAGKDSLESARAKIKKMWNKNKENFRCYNFPTSIATDLNILKFSLDIGFTSFIYEAVKKYKLDMNFIDPADGKTVLDFVKEQEELIRKTPPVNTSKADEYQKIYKMLVENGAKHNWELK